MLESGRYTLYTAFILSLFESSSPSSPPKEILQATSPSAQATRTQKNSHRDHTAVTHNALVTAQVHPLGSLRVPFHLWSPRPNASARVFATDAQEGQGPRARVSLFHSSRNSSGWATFRTASVLFRSESRGGTTPLPMATCAHEQPAIAHKHHYD